MQDRDTDAPGQTQTTPGTRTKLSENKEERNSILTSQRETAKRLEEELMKNKPDAIVVVASLEKLIRWLPGHITPQKYSGVDPLTREMQVFSAYFYGPTLSFLLKDYCNGGVLKRNSQCRDMFFTLLEAGYLEENISVILTLLNENSAEKMLNAVAVLEKVILSACFPQCLLRHCSKVQKDEATGILWDETVRLLTSLPERVANKLKKSTPDNLIPPKYCTIIAYHILQTMHCIAEGLKNDIAGNVEPIGKLLGHLCFVSDSEAILTPLVKWLSIWAKPDQVITRISQKMYYHSPDNAKERIISTLLKITDNHMALYVFLGNSGVTCPKTKYLLTQKFLITRETPKVSVVSAIISYLGMSQENHQLLRSTFLKLLDTWCNKSIMTHSSFDHHIHITRGLLACLPHLSASDVDSCRLDTMQKLLPGIANHLDSPSQQLKLVGMVVAEELTATVHKDGPSLNFEYKPNILTSELKNLSKREQTEETEMEGAHSSKDDLSKSDWFNEFMKELQEADIVSKDKKVQVSVEKLVIPKSTKKPKVIPAKLIKPMDDDKEEENVDLDSDDDEFQPYDMSADTPEVKLKIPFYPQEVLEYLIEGEADQVTAALQVSEKIARGELRKMDPELAVEMTKVLLHLEDKYNTDGFEENRAQTLSALVTSHPTQCALYLGGEFYERNYNIQKRMDILHTLTRAALELSGTDSLIKYALTGASGSSKDKHKAPIKNWMKDIAGCFFYPLVQGLPESRPYLDLMGSDRFLLCDLLKTLGMILKVTGQCEASLKMSACLLEITWSLRTHGDSNVRGACLEAISSGLECVPDSLLLTLVPGEVVELRQWLGEVLKQDREKKCQILAAKLAIRLDRCFSQQLGLP